MAKNVIVVVGADKAVDIEGMIDNGFELIMGINCSWWEADAWVEDDHDLDQIYFKTIMVEKDIIDYASDDCVVIGAAEYHHVPF